MNQSPSSRSWLYAGFDSLAVGILFICGFLVFFGGSQIRIGSAILEVGDMSIWGILLGIFLLSFSGNKEKSHVWIRFNQLITKVQQNGARYFLIGLSWFFTALFLTHLMRFLTMNTNTWDMGIVNNALNFPYGPKFLFCDICRNQTYMGEHPAFAFALIAPITSFLKSSIFIIALQKFVIVAALYLIGARGPLKDAPEVRAWWLFLVVANEGLRAGLLFDFREDILMYGFFMLSAWGIWKGSKLALLVGVLGALSCKENAFASTLLMSGTLVFAKECPWKPKTRWILAGVLVILSFTYVYLNFKFFIPYFVGTTGQKRMALLERFPGLAKTPEDLLLNFLRNPFAFLWALSPNFLSMQALRYVVLVSTVGFFVGWRKWPWLLPAMPPILFNLISAGPGQRDLAYHYDLIVTCWIAVAMAFALRDLRTEPAKLRKKLQIAIVLALITFARSPLFYAYDFIIKDGYNIKAAWDAQFLHPAEPLAGDSFVATTFSHVQKIRFFNPVGHPPMTRIEKIEGFLTQNPKKSNDEEARCSQDAVSWAIRGVDPAQLWLVDEMIRAGGHELYRSHATYETSALIVFELKRPLFDIWCEVDHLCQDEVVARLSHPENGK